jgi:hypothetical protein
LILPINEVVGFQQHLLQRRYCRLAGSPEAPCLAPKLVPRLLNAGFGPADDGYKRKTPAKVYAVPFFYIP